MRLKVGQPAPVFLERDMYDRTVSLSQYWGRRVLVSFYRGAVCPLCNLRLRYLIDRYDDFQRRGLDIIVFFESSPEMARHYLARQQPPFPIIPDLGRVVYDQYGLESSLLGALRAFFFRRPAYRKAARYHVGGNTWENVRDMDGRMGRKPADFLLGPDLSVQVAYYGRDAGDFMPFAEIDRFLEARPTSPWPGYGRALLPGPAIPGYAPQMPQMPPSPQSGYPIPPRSRPGGPPSGWPSPNNYPSGYPDDGRWSENTGWGSNGW